MQRLREAPRRCWRMLGSGMASGERERIGDRGGKWSPLQLGLFSLVCDAFLVPTVSAVSRGLAGCAR